VANILDWLLESSDPSVRHRTLLDILGRSERDPDVIVARRAIPQSSVVKKIMAEQDPRGYWGDPATPYLPKYKASYWQVMILGELGMGRTDKRTSRACEYIFGFQHPEGGFSSVGLEAARREYELLRSKGKRLPPPDEWIPESVHEGQLSCLTGNVVAALLRLGYEDDARLRRAVDWLVRIQNEDGGWLCPYWKAHVGDKHGCFYGTICPLEAFSELPQEKRTREVRSAIERGAEFVLMHRLYKADHHRYRIINRSWLKLAFPSFYGYSVLRGLDVLTKLGYGEDGRMLDAVKLLVKKQRRNGTWVLESAPIGRMHANLEKKGAQSKWVTMIASRTINRLSQRILRQAWASSS